MWRVQRGQCSRQAGRQAGKQPLVCWWGGGGLRQTEKENARSPAIGETCSAWLNHAHWVAERRSPGHKMKAERKTSPRHRATGVPPLLKFLGLSLPLLLCTGKDTMFVCLFVCLFVLTTMAMHATLGHIGCRCFPVA